MRPEPPLTSGRASTWSRGLAGKTRPAPTRLASASRTAKRARVTSGPAALARERASGKDKASGAAAWAGRTWVSATVAKTEQQRRDARALLKRDFKTEPPGRSERDVKCCVSFRYEMDTPALRDVFRS